MPETMFDLVKQFFEDDDWHYDEIPDRQVLAVGYAGVNGSFTCFAQVREGLDQFLFYCLLPTKVPADKRDDVGRFVNLANYGMRIGNFELDYSDGEVRYKTSIDFEDERASHALLRNAVYAAVLTLDRYQPGIMQVVYGNVDPDEAVERIEAPEPPKDVN